MKKSKVTKILIALLAINTNFMLSNKVFAEEASPRETPPELVHELRDLAFNLTHNKVASNELSSEYMLSSDDDWKSLNPWSLEDEPTVKINNDMSLQNADTLAAHNASLFNDTGLEQKMSTAQFEYTQINSVTTKTSHTVGTEMSVTSEMKLPLIGITNTVSMKVKYDFNTSKDVTSSETKKWIVPSQSIIVPAGHHYKVNWLLNTAVATGTTELKSKVKGAVPYWMDHSSGTRYGYANLGYSIYTERRLENALPAFPYKWGARNSWEADGNDAIKNWGKSEYTAKYGTELVMSVVDITNKSAPVLVKSMAMNVMPTTVK